MTGAELIQLVGLILTGVGLCLFISGTGEAPLFDPPEEDGWRPKSSTTQTPKAPPLPMRTDKNGHVIWPDCPRIPPKETRW